MASRSASSRRKFLRNTVTSTAAAALYPALAAARQTGTAPGRAFDVKPFELDEITISELQDSLDSGKYTARSLVEKYSERIANVDKSGPTVNAIIEMNPEAHSIAESLDQERKSLISIE